MRKKGISVIICCFNSSNRIQEVIEFLSKQIQIIDIPLEIVIVDNASGDNTSKVVEELIGQYNYLEINLVFEKKPGLMHAREKGVNESNYEYLLFCDDDNFLSNNYISSVYKIMYNNPDVGVCGGMGIELIRDIEEPHWFNNYKHSYAIGSQIKEKQLTLYGAGMCIRFSAMQKIFNSGFVSYLTGRKGNVLLAGDDGELVLAIYIAGYKIIASDDFYFYHLLPKTRLNEIYLRKMYIGFGMMFPIIKIYRLFVENKKTYSYLTYLFFFTISIFKSFFSALNKKGLDRKVYLALTYGKLKGAIIFQKDIQKVANTIKEIDLNK